MQSGKLRHRIDFQSAALVQNPETGEMVPGWSTVWEKVPASVEPLSTRAFFAAQAAQSEATTRIVIRYRTGVLPTMRILYRGTVHEIKGKPLADSQSGKEYLTILVAEGVNDG